MSTETTLPNISRRQLLQAAGGVTFLALVPTPNGYAARFDRNYQSKTENRKSETALPLFTALPYIQPGTSSSKLAEGQESLVVAWQTNHVPAEFTLDYGASGLNQKANITRAQRLSGDHEDESHHQNYVATLTGLSLNKRYQYRVRMNGEVLMEGYFTTRKPRGVKSRFVAFGDNSYGDISDRAIAYQAYRARPDFMMNTGDNVYEDGLDNEYARYFFPVYNAEQTGQRTGAPLLRSIPYYSVIANHDVHAKGPQGRPVADFTLHNDALAYFTNFHFPLNGPTPAQKTPAYGDAAAIDHFAKCAGRAVSQHGELLLRLRRRAFPVFGQQHLCRPDGYGLAGVDCRRLSEYGCRLEVRRVPSSRLQRGLRPLRRAAHARSCRPCSRSMALTCCCTATSIPISGRAPSVSRRTALPEPKTSTARIDWFPASSRLTRASTARPLPNRTALSISRRARAASTCTTRKATTTPKSWLHPEDNNADYVVRFVSDRHSLTVFDMDANSLTMTQIDEWGNTIDRIRITKADCSER